MIIAGTMGITQWATCAIFGLGVTNGKMVFSPASQFGKSNKNIKKETKINLSTCNETQDKNQSFEMHQQKEWESKGELGPCWRVLSSPPSISSFLNSTHITLFQKSVEDKITSSVCYSVSLVSFCSLETAPSLHRCTFLFLLLMTTHRHRVVQFIIPFASP